METTATTTTTTQIQVEEFTGSTTSDQKNNPILIKGKRTKRQRPFSPFPPPPTSSSCSAGAGDHLLKNHQSPTTTTTSSEGEFSTTTQEEEDMANCLILLAQGGPQKQSSRRRYSETAGGGGSGSGEGKMLVYECKTCNRTFPSFQALGGHRASHKKPKLSSMPEDNKLLLVVPTIPKSSSSSLSSSSSQNYDHVDSTTTDTELRFGKITQLPLVSPPHLPTPLMANNNKSSSSKPKVHECSICGSEFSSGQALGGHMRRHRTTPTPATTQQIPINNIMPTDTNTTTIDQAEEKPHRHVLTLDLNLPAPSEDDHQQHQHHPEPSNFQFRPTQQQHLLFSSPALVDCHY